MRIRFSIIAIVMFMSLGTGMILSPGVLAYKAAYTEEDADTVLPSDRVIIGSVEKYEESMHSIVVDDEEYQLCRVITVYNERGEPLELSFLSIAEKAKIFINGRVDCVRKVKILKFRK